MSRCQNVLARLFSQSVGVGLFGLEWEESEGSSGGFAGPDSGRRGGGQDCSSASLTLSEPSSGRNRVRMKSRLSLVMRERHR